jgi:hypothetical protein
MAGALSNIRLRFASVSLLLALAACGGTGGGVQASADRTTKAAYDDNVEGVTQNFDEALKTQVTRSEVGIMSDQMHQLGDYHGLTFVNSDPNKNEYTYRADFTRGHANVVVRLDADGRFAAYRFLVPK